MKYKMIVSDYDNTLCNKQKIVTPRTRKAIKDFTDQGGRFVICTTRPYIGIKGKALDLGLKDEVIADQGACVRNLKDDSIVFQSLLTYDQCKDILDYFYSKTRHIFLSSDFDMKTKNFDYFAKQCTKIVDYPLEKTRTTLIDDCNHMDVNQIIIGYYIPAVVKHMAKLAGEKFKGKFKVGICDRHLLNVTNTDVSKGQAIEKIAKLHNIKKEEIISFGDSLNDSSMYEYSGVGVAMGNSMSGLKEKATVVCDHVERDGLAKFIEQNCLDDIKEKV